MLKICSEKPLMIFPKIVKEWDEILKVKKYKIVYILIFCINLSDYNNNYIKLLNLQID